MKRDWSLQEKIGQLVMCGFHGTVPSAHMETLIRDYRIGGVIYFRRNVSGVRQMAAMSAELQQLNEEAGATLPLLVAIDQEGGMVARIDRGVTLVPGSMALGAIGDPAAAYETANISGSELRAMGINMNFAPCLDVNSNPDNPVIGIRSYGENPALVGELGLAAIRGFQDAGVAATAKHFPGHGDTAMDSHHAMPVLAHDMERLNRVELAPFRQAIEEGVAAIMTAHVLFPALEPDGRPSTLSPHVIDGLLRGQLGYDGVVVTDCLEMNAIAGTIGVAEGAVQAVEAGADLILVSHRFDRQLAALEALREAVLSGRISEVRIDRSLERLARLKQRLAAAPGASQEAGEASCEAGEAGGSGSSGGAEELAAIGCAERLRVARRASERSVTLVKSGGLLPLDRRVKTYVVWTEVRANTEVEEVIPQDETAGYYLKAAMNEVFEQRIGTQPDEREIERVLAESEGCGQIVFVTYNASFSSGQTRLVRELAAREGVRLIVAAGRNPFDLLAFPEVGAYLACYENRPNTMRALAAILLGELQPQGKLPVSIGERFPFGWSGKLTD
ncbi:beta-N-acetylhexosaminidase [Paenibacillus sp. MBLB4367]|uniref:beta-N-acetylhexosaminidase n=1 Tax=Paenibacillus sp. MBLB4367 TaxID=3384767 RepID=UPI00390808B6